MIRVVLSWLHLQPGTRLFRTWRLLTAFTDPYLRPFRRLVPISRFGMSAPHDYSVLVALLLLYVVAYVLMAI